MKLRVALTAAAALAGGTLASLSSSRPVPLDAGAATLKSFYGCAVGEQESPANLSSMPVSCARDQIPVEVVDVTDFDSVPAPRP